MDITQDKRELRALMKQVRSEVSGASREMQSQAASNVAESEWLGPLRVTKGEGLNVFCYMSFGDEPDTGHLLRSCRERGDTLIVPRVAGREMKLYLLEDPKLLVPGLWGIPEPPKSAEEWDLGRYSEIDAVVIPGLAFDRKGGRIGYGAGYYDRFIADIRSSEVTALRQSTYGTPPVRLGALALREQLVEGVIPMEPHDFRVDMIFLPEGMLCIKAKL